MAVEFLILGPLELRHEGHPIELGGTRRRALVAALLLRAGELVSPDWLIQALWGEEAAPSAANALQAHVSRVRRDLGPLADRLRTEPGGYRLVVEPGELDAQRFQQECERARTLPPAERTIVLRAALALWRGPALADLAHETFAQNELRRLEELRQQATEERLEAELALGEHSRALNELEPLIAEHPLRERLRGLHMLALYRLGRHAEALDSYRDLRTRLDEELGLEPSPELRELEQAILVHDVPSATPDLPALATPTVGREDALRRVAELLETTRLLTLIGPGGVGKTRLALELARARGGRFVSLAALNDAEQLAPAVSDALRIARVPGERAEDALRRTLHGEPTTLVLDNLEHLPGAAAVIGRLLSNAPTLTVVGTSRHPLGLQAEQRFPVPPLAEQEAIKLFESRARARDPEFAITEQTRPTIEIICRRLGGLPLAIELAAARIGVLDPAGLAARLSDALDLGPGPADAPERQRTLRATLDWSYELLDEPEREAFAAFGAFAGGADLEAAEAVSQAPLHVIEALVDKSLVIVARGRFHLLEPVRRYAAERGSDAIRARHAEHYLALAERTRSELWLRGNGTALFEAVNRERDNFRAALTASRGTATAVKLVGALDPYWWLAHAEDEGRAWLEQALAAAAGDGDERDLARAQLAIARLFPPSSPGVIEHATAALERYRELGDHAGCSRCLVRLASEHNINANPEAAIALAGEAVEEARKASDLALIGHTLTRLAGCTEDIEDALALLEEGVADLRQAGATGQISGGISLVAFRALYAERYDDADRLLTEAMSAAGASQTPLHARARPRQSRARPAAGGPRGGRTRRLRRPAARRARRIALALLFRELPRPRRGRRPSRRRRTGRHARRGRLGVQRAPRGRARTARLRPRRRALPHPRPHTRSRRRPQPRGGTRARRCGLTTRRG